MKGHYASWPAPYYTVMMASGLPLREEMQDSNKTALITVLSAVISASDTAHTEIKQYFLSICCPFS